MDSHHATANSISATSRIARSSDIGKDTDTLRALSTHAHTTPQDKYHKKKIDL